MKRKSKRKSGKKKSSLRKRKSKKFDSGKLISTPKPVVVELKYINTKCPFFKELWKLEGVIEYYTDMSAKDIIKMYIKNNKKEYKNNIVPVAKQKLVEDVNVYIVMNVIVDYEKEGKEEIKNYLITLKDEK
jgi:cell division protein YceG involved in septum cleavage